MDRLKNTNIQNEVKFEVPKYEGQPFSLALIGFLFIYIINVQSKNNKLMYN